MDSLLNRLQTKQNNFARGQGSVQAEDASGNPPRTLHQYLRIEALSFRCYYLLREGFLAWHRNAEWDKTAYLREAQLRFHFKAVGGLWLNPRGAYRLV